MFFNVQPLFFNNQLLHVHTIYYTERKPLATLQFIQRLNYFSYCLGIYPVQLGSHVKFVNHSAERVVNLLFGREQKVHFVVEVFLHQTNCLVLYPDYLVHSVLFSFYTMLHHGVRHTVLIFPPHTLPATPTTFFLNVIVRYHILPRQSIYGDTGSNEVSFQYQPVSVFYWSYIWMVGPQPPLTNHRYTLTKFKEPFGSSIIYFSMVLF